MFILFRVIQRYLEYLYFTNIINNIHMTCYTIRLCQLNNYSDCDLFLQTNYKFQLLNYVRKQCYIILYFKIIMLHIIIKKQGKLFSELQVASRVWCKYCKQQIKQDKSEIILNSAQFAKSTKFANIRQCFLPATLHRDVDCKLYLQINT